MRVRFQHIKSTATVMLVMVPLLAGADVSRAALDARYVKVINQPAGGIYWPGDTIEVECKVSNTGGASYPNYSAEFTLRHETDIYFLGRLERGPISSGSADIFTASFTVPEDIMYNTYGVMLVVSRDNWSDNAGSARIQVGPLVAELSPLSVDAADGRYHTGDLLLISCIVDNTGDVDPGGYAVDFYASTDEEITADDFLLGSTMRNGLACGAEDAFESVFTIPSELADGMYYIGGVIDYDADRDVRNNSVSDSDPIWVGPFADLAVESVSVPGGTYSPHSEIVVTSVVKNVGDSISEAYVLDYYASTDEEITSRDQHIGHVERSRLGAGQQHSFGATCRLPAYLPAGTCYIGAITSCRNDSHWRNDSGCVTVPVTVAHPAGYVCGQMLYEDRFGFPHPIRFAQVELYEGQDEAGDPEITRSYTDQSGNFGVTVPPTGQDRSMYVKVRTQGVSGAYPGTTSTIVEVKDDVLEEHYFYTSSSYELSGDSSLVMNVKVPESHGAFMVYDSIVEGFIKAKAFLGIELDGITTFWPCAANGTFYVSGGSIHVAREDRGDRDVIMHEYGHYVAHVCDFAQGSVGEYPPQHYWNTDLRYTPWYHTDEQARNFAFREAWPTLFSIATQYGDRWYPDAGDTKYQDTVEWFGWTYEVDLEKDTADHSSPGEFYENMVCCALWDIFDDEDDVVDDNDTLSDVGLDKIWAVTQDYQPESMRNFWDGWLASLDYTDEITRIFADHGMNFPKAPSASSEGFETGDFSLFEWAHSGEAPWVVTVETRHQGLHCARAGAVGDSQSTTLKVTLPCEAGEIRFWRKVSSEEGWDKLQFYIDGWKKGEWSGELDWEEVTFDVEAGDRTFRWVYMKSTMTSTGADTAWIDDIDFPVALASP